MIEETTKAYLAGIMDGEGSIGIYIVRNGSRYATHMLQISVGMTEPQAVRLIADSYGVKTHINSRPHTNSKDRLVVTLRSDNALRLLRDIEPYMLVKKEHARIGIAFQESKINRVRDNAKGWGAGRRPLTKTEWDKRESYRLQMYALSSGQLGVDPSRRRAVAETEWRGTGHIPVREATVRTP